MLAVNDQFMKITMVSLGLARTSFGAIGVRAQFNFWKAMIWSGAGKEETEGPRQPLRPQVFSQGMPWASPEGLRIAPGF
ncbi:MAG: hypothetical protein M2R45_02647 [Verrucomicrobia subdivision 3 bacterium]|nr:hypothetical protein [Limisphaerales bacterium]MCS1414024.1 hypothetical protein [Limisphaerales bacterium]